MCTILQFLLVHIKTSRPIAKGFGNACTAHVGFEYMNVFELHIAISLHSPACPSPDVAAGVVWGSAVEGEVSEEPCSKFSGKFRYSQANYYVCYC